MRVNGTDIDDGSARGHVRHAILAEQEYGAEIDVKNLVPVLFGQLEYWLKRHHRRIVHHHIDPAPLLYSGADRAVHFLWVADIAVNEDRLAAAGGNLLNGLISVRVVEIQDGDHAAFAGELFCAGLTDSRSGPANQTHFGGKAHNRMRQAAD